VGPSRRTYPVETHTWVSTGYVLRDGPTGDNVHPQLLWVGRERDVSTPTTTTTTRTTLTTTTTVSTSTTTTFSPATTTTSPPCVPADCSDGDLCTIDTCAGA